MSLNYPRKLHFALHILSVWFLITIIELAYARQITPLNTLKGKSPKSDLQGFTLKDPY